MSMVEGSSGMGSKNKKNEKSVKSDQNKENDILNYKLKQQLPLTKSQIFKQTMNSIKNDEKKQSEISEIPKAKMMR